MKYLIKVSATSANLGVGFDVLGLSLDLYNEFYIEKSNEFEIADYSLDLNDHLFYQSYMKIADVLEIKPQAFKLKIVTNIPIARGLGSSATLVLAAVKALSLLNDLDLSDEMILKYSLMIENHPDNLTPALYGGLKVLGNKDNYFKELAVNISSKFDIYLFIPNYQVITEKARIGLRSEFSISELTHQANCLIHLIKGLEDFDMELLSYSNQDLVHENIRKNNILEYDFLKNILDGYLVISGSGPTLIYLSDKEISENVVLKIKEKFGGLEIKKTSVSYTGLSYQVIQG